MKHLFAVLLVGCSTLAHGQLIRKSASLTCPTGEVVLRDSVRVDLDRYEMGSYQCALHVWVHRDFVLSEGKSLVADAPLLSESKDTLGFTTTRVVVDTLWQSTTRRMSRFYEAVLVGSVQDRDLRSKSLPTAMIEAFYNERAAGSLVENLVELLKAQGWEYRPFGDFEAWSFMNEQRPWRHEFAALLVFRNGQPYCLVNHGEEFEYDKLKGKEENRLGTFYFFQRANERYKEDLENLVYSYIPL